MGFINIGPVWYGDTEIFDFTCEEPDGSLADLTQNGTTVRWGYALKSAPTVVLGTKTNRNGGLLILAGGTLGRVGVFMANGEIPAGKYIHELEVNFPTGATYTYAHGILTISNPLFPNPYPN